MVRNFLLVIVMFLASSIARGQPRDERFLDFDVDENHVNVLEPPTRPTAINVGITLIEVMKIEPASEENPKITAQFKLHTQWQDIRLKTLLSDKHKVHAFQDADVTEKLNRIFDPRISIIDGIMQVEHQHLRIFPSGTVSLSQVVTVTTSANMDLRHFPFDSQLFNFHFASTYWDESEIDLILNPYETSIKDHASPVSWTIDFAGYHITKSSVRAHSETFYVFNFMVHAQRDPRNFIWRLLLPLIVIVILSWNVFWMHEDSSMALANCFVFLLTVVSFHQIANDMLPIIPIFTFMDAIVFISYGYIIIPTFAVMITTKLETRRKSELAQNIRRQCRWFVPVSFVLTLLTTTIIYFISA